jgi:hypothetical protein
MTASVEGTSRPVRALVGERAAGAAALLGRLLRPVRGDAGDSGPTGSSTPESSGRLRLDTKYYVADVSCEVRDLDAAAAPEDAVAAPEDAVAAVAAAAPPPTAAAEALVLCFDPTRDGGFDRVASWALTPTAERVVNAAEVRLLACVYPTERDAAEDAANGHAALRRADGWAVERGFEAVAVIASDDSDAREADARLALDGDPHGTTRIRAALEAHVWPGLVPKEIIHKDEGGKDEGGKDEVEVEDEVSEVSEVSFRRGSAAGAADDSASPLLDSASSEDDSAASLALLEQMEALAAEVARVRAAGAGASDGERRRMAAEAATRMMAAFVSDGESGDEDEDEGAPTPRRSEE